MSKTYVRVDDRLIHGQTIMSWAPTLKLEEFIAVDDTIAANPMLKSILTILTMGCPRTTSPTSSRPRRRAPFSPRTTG